MAKAARMRWRSSCGDNQRTMQIGTSTVAGFLCLAIVATAAQELALRRLEAEQEIRGRIEASDPMRPDNSHYQDWIFSAAQGTPIVITLRSMAFDSFLDVGRYDANNRWQSLATDDDGGGGRDAKLTFVAPAGGDYIARVITLNSLLTGPFTLLLQAQ